MFNSKSKSLLLLVLLTVTTSFAQNASNQIEKIASQAYFNAGLDLVKVEKYNAAIKAFANCIKNDAKNADAYLNLGACYDRQGKFDVADKYYLKAIRLDPKNARLQYLYGTALIRNDKNKKGLAHIEKAVYLQPRNQDYLFDLGIAYSENELYLEANQCFAEIHKNIKNNSLVSYYYGMSMFMSGKTNKAMKIWREVDMDSPYAPDVYCNLAALELAKGQAKEALDKLKLAIKLNPSLTKCYLLMAECYQELGDYEKATKLLENLKGENKQPVLCQKLIQNYMMWGQQLSKNKKYKLALEKYKEALRFDDNKPEVHLALAENYQNLRKNDLALKEVELLQEMSLTELQKNKVIGLRKQLELYLEKE